MSQRYRTGHHRAITPVTSEFTTDGVGGRCPSLARAVREQLDRQYGSQYAEAVARLGELRDPLIAAGWASRRIHAAVSTLMDNGLVEAIASGNEARVAALLTGASGDAGTSAVGHTR